MVAHRYRELACWQLANDLKRRVYAFIAKPPVANDFKFCAQIRDAARGGPRAISEGFGRFRPADFARYLEYARASLIETQNHIDDALDSDYLSAAEHKTLWRLADRAVGAMTKLHAYLQTQKAAPPVRVLPTRTGTQNPAPAKPPHARTQHEPRTQHAEPRTQNPAPRTENEP